MRQDFNVEAEDGSPAEVAKVGGRWCKAKQGMCDGGEAWWFSPPLGHKIPRARRGRTRSRSFTRQLAPLPLPESVLVSWALSVSNCSVPDIFLDHARQLLFVTGVP
jgi:hypothetical protein